MGFGQGLSGLNAASQNLDVIGNNIANSSTVGFKASTIAFADVYASSRVGLGVQVASVNQRFTAGNVDATGNQFDMAIDGDKGVFRLVDQSGAVVYSRNGQFAPNKNFDLVNAQGHRLTGYMVNPDGTLSAELGPIRVPVGNIEPKATEKIEVKTNLDSRSEEVTVTPFDRDNPETFTHSSPMTVYDSLGNPHQLTQYFIKEAGTAGASNWSVEYYLDDTPVGTEDLTFDENGVLPNPAPIHTLTIPNPGGTNSPAADLAIEIAFSGSTSFGGEFSPKLTQNGYSTGEYSSMSIASNGDIVANYTNGESKTMGAIVLADFNNINGLKPIGGNAWVETGESGQPILGKPGTNSLATLKGQAVEASNVDMSQELVNMIIAQRTYQANAQTIKTQDQILQTLITLR